MSTNRFRLRVGLMTLMVVSVMLAFSQSAAHAAKPGTPPPPPPPPVTYAMRLMPLPSGVPAGTSFYVTGMNNAGQVVAWGYLWNSVTNKVIDLAAKILVETDVAERWPLGVNLRFENAVINDLGQVAAEVEFWTPPTKLTEGFWTTHAFRYTPAHDTTPAEFLDLELPTGWGSVTVRAINNLGNIVGDVEYGIDAGSMPVLWDCLGNPADPLDNVFNTMPELIDGRAWAVNDLNQVTGSMLLGGAYHAYRYTPGDLSPEDLGVLYSRNPGSIGRDINNLGDVAGWSYVTRPKDSWYDRYGIAHAFLDTGGGLINLGALSSGGSTRACWINDIGNVVGSARSGSPNWTPTWFLYTSETGMLDLLKLINGLPPGTTGDTCTLSGINDYPNLDNPGPFGQICGTIAIDGVWIPFVLTPD